MRVLNAPARERGVWRDDRLGAVVNPESGVDVLEVLFDGAAAEREVVGDLGRRESVEGELEDLGLAAGEAEVAQLGGGSGPGSGGVSRPG